MKEEWSFPDKFYCKCGIEISESELIGCGMCNNCFIKFKNNKINEHIVKEVEDYTAEEIQQQKEDMNYELIEEKYF